MNITIVEKQLAYYKTNQKLRFPTKSVEDAIKPKQFTSTYIEQELLTEMKITKHVKELQKIANSLTCVLYYYVECWEEIGNAYVHANNLAKKHRLIRFVAINANNPEFEVILFDSDLCSNTADFQISCFSALCRWFTYPRSNER